MAKTDKTKSGYLSKSQFIRGLQCHKALYLYKYQPELMDETPESRKQLFQTGLDVGIYAHGLFPGGIEIPFEGVSISEQIEQTKNAIEAGAATLYEASFSFKQTFAKADILHCGKGGWELYEVKASTGIEEVHINDVASQYYVLNGAGLHIAKAFLVHIDNSYIRNGDIEVKKLFSAEDITDAVKLKQPFIVEQLKSMREMLQGEMPAIDIGEYCDAPYPCDFKGYCWKDIPEDSVFMLRGRGVNKFELYREGILCLKDIPTGILNDKQRLQVEAFLEKKEVVNKDAIREFISSLWYPLYFLDFETTFMVPIPLFDGTRPYQEVPFQYSLHCLEKEGGELTHYEYLAPDSSDPRRELIKNLVEQIPKNACVLVYNKTFEAKILNYLKDWFPKYKARIENIVNNLRDLMVPFQQQHFYHWELEGSYSLKYVLPVLVPELSYDEMEVSDGGEAANAYFQMCAADDPKEKERIRAALLKYCGLDTLGMVRILEKLKELCRG